MATSESSILDEITRELSEKLEPGLLPLLDKRDGAARLTQDLPNVYSPEKIIDGSKECRAWELAGLYYLNRGRPYEALPLFTALYDHMLAGQGNGRRVHKGMPLVWICECYLMMGFAALPKTLLNVDFMRRCNFREGQGVC